MTNPIELSPRGANALDRLISVRNQINYYKDLEAQARAIIEAEMGDTHDAATVDGVEVVAWSLVKSNRLDQSALRAAHPQVYDLFCKPVESRRFVIR